MTIVNSQSDGKHRIKKMEFEFLKKSYKFLFNPEEYNQTEPNKVTVTQTKYGGWADDFGPGLASISFQGTTGFKGTSKDPTTGYKKYVELRDLIRAYMARAKSGHDVTGRNLVFHNYTDDEHWIVAPKTFSLLRSVKRPLMYMYDVELYCLAPADTPDNITPYSSEIKEYYRLTQLR